MWRFTAVPYLKGKLAPAFPRPSLFLVSVLRNLRNCMLFYSPIGGIERGYTQSDSVIAWSFRYRKAINEQCIFLYGIMPEHGLPSYAANALLP
jgi:hypothetical protein